MDDFNARSIEVHIKTSHLNFELKCVIYNNVYFFYFNKIYYYYAHLCVKKKKCKLINTYTIKANLKIKF